MEKHIILSTKVDSPDSTAVHQCTIMGFPEDERMALLRRVHEFGGEAGLYSEDGTDILVLPVGDGNART